MCVIIHLSGRRARGIKRYVWLFLAAAICFSGIACGSPAASTDQSSSARGDAAIGEAYRNRLSGFFVESSGTVIKILPDDLEGSRHQRFILKLKTGQTLLISHNIDLAPRVAGLQVGVTVSFRGRYEWNDKGGVVHWTHRDPSYKQMGGWIKYQGRRYE